MNKPCFYRVSVKGLVRDTDGKILLARESNGLWELIGGGLEHGEDPVDGLRREIMEETGLIAEKISAHPKYFLTAKRPNGGYTANILYSVTLKNLNFTASEECQELRYFRVDEAEKLDLYPNVIELLKLLKSDK